MTDLPTPPEVEAYEAQRDGLAPWPIPNWNAIRMCKLADAALAARSRQAEELAARLSQMEEAVEQATQYLAPGGYSEELSARVLTDPVLHAFAYVATKERQAREAAEARIKELDGLLATERDVTKAYEAQVKELELVTSICSGPCHSARGAEYVDRARGLEADNECLRAALGDSLLFSVREAIRRHDLAACLAACRERGERRERFIIDLQRTNDRLREQLPRLTDERSATYVTFAPSARSRSLYRSNKRYSYMLRQAVRYVNVKRLMSRRPYPAEKNRGVMLELERRWNEIPTTDTEENTMSRQGGG